MGIREGIVDVTESLLINAMESFDDMCATACSVLSGTGTGGNMVTSAWTSVIGLSTNFSTFANIIAGICILLELVQVASKVDLIKWEHGLKCGFKMCVARLCIDTAPTFLRACYNQAGLFITAMGGSSPTLASTVTPLISTACGEVSTLGEAIGLLCSTLLLSMGIKICGLLIVVMAYGRAFEILMYVLVSPVPVAFACYNGGHDGFGRITTKFVKGFIAVCLSGVMMYGCITLFGTLLNTSFTALVTASSGSGATGSAMVSDLCYDMLLFTIVLIMVVTKCGGWAKQLMDA